MDICRSALPLARTSVGGAIMIQIPRNGTFVEGKDQYRESPVFEQALWTWQLLPWVFTLQQNQTFDPKTKGSASEREGAAP